MEAFNSAFPTHIINVIAPSLAYVRLSSIMPFSNRTVICDVPVQEHSVPFLLRKAGSHDCARSRKAWSALAPGIFNRKLQDETVRRGYGNSWTDKREEHASGEAACVLGTDGLGVRTRIGSSSLIPCVNLGHCHRWYRTHRNTLYTIRGLIVDALFRPK